jgi:hypothetical protein
MCIACLDLYSSALSIANPISVSMSIPWCLALEKQQALQCICLFSPVSQKSLLLLHRKVFFVRPSVANFVLAGLCSFVCFISTPSTILRRGGGRGLGVRMRKCVVSTLAIRRLRYTGSFSWVSCRACMVRALSVTIPSVHERPVEPVAVESDKDVGLHVLDVVKERLQKRHLMGMARYSLQSRCKTDFRGTRRGICRIRKPFACA